MEKKECNVYIDESGDLGIGKGTRWFVITAVIAEKDKEKELRSIIKGIKNQLNIQTIHFREIREFNKKLYIVSQLKDAPFTIVNVIVDTSLLELSNGIKTYNFMSKILLERVSWYLRDHQMVANVVFSSRNSKRDNELTNYLNTKVINYEWNEIAEGTIVSVTSKKMENVDMLQLADICAASFYKSHETDRFGFVYPCYMNNLKTHLYSYNGQVNKYGIKYYREKMRPDESFFLDKEPCDYFNKK